MSKMGDLVENFRSLSNRAGLEVGLRRVRRSTRSRRVIYFLHLGKAAGSQVAQAIGQINQRQRAVYLQAMRHEITLKDLPEPADYFFSIRDPISRFRSGFYSRKRFGRPRYNVPWTKYEAEAFAVFEDANDLAESLFEPGEMGVRALAAIKSIRHMAEDQIDWFTLTGDIFAVRQPVWIIRQENFEEDFAELLRRADIDYVPSLRRDPVGSHANDYSGVPELSDKARDNLRRWYVQDYAFRESCEEWMRRKSAAR